MIDMNNTIAIGSDHAGFIYKSAVIDHLQKKGFEVKDHGTFTEASCDYPDYAHAVAEAVEKENAAMGILICGSANGVAITANKHQGIRAAICWEKEIASLARQHNDANIICIPARFVSIDLALGMADLFLSTSFEGGRHLNRVQKIKI
ncbi:MAG: ribose 5-phosphate isomerase [Bacteroidota bacterium]|jgi:ribose 5-phosphate isomerase B